MKKSIKTDIYLILLACSAALCPNSAFASTEVFFSDRYVGEDMEMVLKGRSTKNFIFQPVFTSGLYMLPAAETARVLGNQPKRLEVHYLTHVPKKKLSKYTVKKMKDNLSNEEFSSIAAKLVEMDDYFVDLSPGDRFAITYIPGQGTKFEHNGKLRGVIKGEKFAKGVFSVWLGEKPMDERLKYEMLGFNLQ